MSDNILGDILAGKPAPGPDGTWATVKPLSDGSFCVFHISCRDGYPYVLTIEIPASVGSEEAALARAEELLNPDPALDPKALV